MTAPAGDALSHENLGRMRIADRTKISRARRPSFFETDSAAPNHGLEIRGDTPLRPTGSVPPGFAWRP
jgi:hypothetical protein